MTTGTPKNKRGKVKGPKEVALTIETTWGAYIDYIGVIATHFTATDKRGISAVFAALQAATEWLVKYAGVSLEELRALDKNDVEDVFLGARVAFGDTDIPQTKSAP